MTLAVEPDERARAVLESEGLSPGGDTTIWSGRITGGLETLSSLGPRITDSGVAVEEVRVREPGLRGVFFRATGREFEP